MLMVVLRNEITHNITVKAILLYQGLPQTSQATVTVILMPTWFVNEIVIDFIYVPWLIEN